MNDVLERLAAMRRDDLPIGLGRTLAYVYDAGLPQLDRVAAQAVGAFAATNGLDPTAFPSLLEMENDLVGYALDLLGAPETAVGTVTSGGTESCLLAVQTARDAAGKDRPNMVVPDTVHAAFHKAAHYFGIELRSVTTTREFRADPAAMAAAMDDRTVLVVGSAPSYAHGVVDPVPDLAAIAAERGVRMHVDACIGGWILGYAARIGRDVPDWDFAVDGVTSISVDTHKYAYAPKGTSLLLHRTPELRREQYFACAAWPGYTMLNSTLQGTKSGGPLAGAWVVVKTLGHDGYEDLTLQAFAAVDRILDGLADLPLTPVAAPDATLISLRTDASCDPFTVCDEMKKRGWYLQPQMSFGRSPANIHLSVSAATNAHVEEFLAALREAVEKAQSYGPVQVDEGVVEFIAALDPAALSEDDFDGLLAASGLLGGGELVLPEEMAPINAMLDLAAPRMREALLEAFLDRLARPHRHPVP